MTTRAPWAVGLVMAGALLLAGCAAPLSPVATPGAVAITPDPSAIGAVGAGFYDPAHLPAPEGTFDPTPGSWDDVHPAAGYRVVLVSAGDAVETSTLVGAVRSWADSEKVDLTELTPTSSADYLSVIERAIAQSPDLIISAGHDLVDPMAAITPSYLSQRFLVLGAEIAEPTGNVTAADWTGAGFRGEGLGTPTDHDPATFTDERAGRALRAGVAAVLTGLTGYVVWVD